MKEEIDRITNKLDESIKNATPIFKPTPIDREDGFYATVDYNRSDEDKDVKLEEKPSLTSKDIKEVTKTLSTVCIQRLLFNSQKRGCTEALVIN
jgi:hypothetical protein